MNPLKNLFINYLVRPKSFALLLLVTQVIPLASQEKKPNDPESQTETGETSVQSDIEDRNYIIMGVSVWYNDTKSWIGRLFGSEDQKKANRPIDMLGWVVDISSRGNTGQDGSEETPTEGDLLTFSLKEIKQVIKNPTNAQNGKKGDETIMNKKPICFNVFIIDKKGDQISLYKQGRPSSTKEVTIPEREIKEVPIEEFLLSKVGEERMDSFRYDRKEVTEFLQEGFDEFVKSGKKNWPVDTHHISMKMYYSSHIGRSNREPVVYFEEDESGNYDFTGRSTLKKEKIKPPQIHFTPYKKLSLSFVLGIVVGLLIGYTISVKKHLLKIKKGMKNEQEKQEEQETPEKETKEIRRDLGDDYSAEVNNHSGI